jgi:hypothetical protein
VNVTRALLVVCLASCRHRAAASHVDASPVVDASSDASDGAADAEDAADAQPDAHRVELPRGGREIFPKYRLVGFCGTPGGKNLGRLLGNLPARAKEIETFGAEYAGDRTPLPVFELIAVVATGLPGLDGKSRRRVPDKVVDDYLHAARDARALLLLNIQPGHSDFMTEVRHFESFLKEPDVGLALDPEWAMSPTSKEKPGAKFGEMSGATLNEVGQYLSDLVAQNDLPEKVLVFHQVNTWVFKDDPYVKAHDGVVIVKSVDGLGQKDTKIKTYNVLVNHLSPAMHPGFKLFFDEDTAGGHKLMTPEQVLGLTPVPEYVMYE